MLGPYVSLSKGNVVLHFKRYTKDRWLPDSADPTTYLSDEDKYGILVFKASDKKPDIVSLLIHVTML